MEREQSGILLQGPDPIHKGPTFTFPKAPLPIAIILGLRISTVEFFFWGGTDIQSVNTSHLFSKINDIMCAIHLY